MTSNSSKKPKLMVENISCILPQESGLGGLFLGNVYGAQNAAILKQYGIRAVLTTSIETDIEYSFRDVPFHMRISAHDNENYNMREHINECIQFIQQSRYENIFINYRQLTNVYVHCFAGVSRSAAIVCAYIMWKLKWNFETTMAFVKAKRIVAKPNQGFVKQLMELECMLQGVTEDMNENNSGFIDIEERRLTNDCILPPKSENLLQNNARRDSLKNTDASLIKKTIETYPTNQLYKMPTSQQHLQKPQKEHLSHHSKALSQYQMSVPPTSNPKTHTDNSLYYVDPEKLKSKNSMQKKDSIKTAATTTTVDNNKFAYLQNFFPQNNSNAKNYQLEKQKSRICSMSTGGGGEIVSGRKSLKGGENVNVMSENVIQKHAANYYVPLKPSQSSLASNHLILGGRKPQPLPPQPNRNSNSNSNSIPISNIKQQPPPSSANKPVFVKSDPPPVKVINSKPNEAQLYHPLNSGYNTNTNTHNRISSDTYSKQNSRLKINNNQSGVKNQVNNNKVTSPRVQQTTPSYLKFDQHTGMKSPNNHTGDSNHLSGQRFDFRNYASTSSQGYLANTKLSAQKIEANKSTSRLVKPKDLPGYKNY